MRRLILWIVLTMSAYQVPAQYLTYARTDYDDSFGEWEIGLEIDSTTTIEGDLKITWPLEQNFSEWQYSMDTYQGEISQKFKNNPSYWELKSSTNEIVSIRQVWTGDARSWKISGGEYAFVINVELGENTTVWYNSQIDNIGLLEIYTAYKDDIRDWVIDDYMNDTIPFSMRMAAVFISIYSSMPKF